MSVSQKEKLELPEQRIIKLKDLINHWKTSNIPSRRSTVDFVEAILAHRKDTNAS